MKLLQRALLAFCFLILAISAHAQVAMLDGSWHSPQWKYGYVLKDGVGVATSTNSPNFQVGQSIIQLSATSSNTFTGQQVYTDGNFYQVTATLLVDGRLSFVGEKNVKWVMERISAPPQASLPASQTSAAAPSSVSTLQPPLAQATQTQPAASPLFPAPTQSNQVVSPASSIQTSNVGRGDQPKVQTVVVEGVGTDVQGAAQNAAQNALTNIVGSFIDATNMVDKRTQIADGIRTQTKDIKSNIKEYSQGNIQAFEILDTKNDSGLFKVTAKVSVRIEDFRAYIKKLAEGETAVSGGLFTQAQSMTNQTTNKLKLLNDLLRPLVNGEVIQFAVENPIPLTNADYRGGVPGLDGLIKSNGVENIFLLKVTASLDPNFLANMKRVVESTSSAQMSAPQTGMEFSNPKPSFPLNFNKQLAVPFIFYDRAFPLLSEQERNATNSPSKFADIYMIDNARTGLLEPIFKTDLDVEILGDNSSVLQRERYSYNNVNGRNQSSRRITIYGNQDRVFGPIPWRLMSATSPLWGYYALSVAERRTFSVAIAIDPAALKDAKKIVVRIVN